MQLENRKSLSDFWVAGINYRKTDATIRGQFAINNEQYANIISLAPVFDVNEFFILSTCNRTEVYGFASDVNNIIDLLCTQTSGTCTSFKQLSYVKNGAAAVNHLLEVAAGLDSQVLGDYEIVGQMKLSAKFAKDNGMVGAFLERLLNTALQSSKAIKTNTKLSGGTVSVSFGAIQYIRENVADYQNKSILLLGVGKIGRNTCKNLVDYLETKNVTLINRSMEKAQVLAEEFGLKYAPVEETEKYIKESDIIITATSAQKYLVTAEHLTGCNSKVLIDLCIPYNVDPAVKNLEGVSLMNVDELSKMKDETLQMRLAEIPKAKEIIREHQEEFIEWFAMRQNVPVLVSLKMKLNQIEETLAVEIAECTTSKKDERIQKQINTTAKKLKFNNARGCHYIQAINEYIAVS
jgi:glutamyl-tRNA reductase